MQRKTKFLVAVGIIAGGVALALFFRQPPSQPPDAADLARPPVLRRAMRQPTQPTCEPPGKGPASSPAEQQLRMARASAAPAVVEPVDQAQPPNLPRTYPSGARLDADWQGNRISAPLGLGTVCSAAADQPQKHLVHTIADGDSLPALAQRYLGSAERWPEIYQANQDLLTSPDLLPIGLQLSIPLSSPASSLSSAAETGERASEGQSAGGMRAAGLSAVGMAAERMSAGGMPAGRSTVDSACGESSDPRSAPQPLGPLVPVGKGSGR